MKIRNGFVSNSSSSSFIVCFPEKPTSPEHLFKTLFGSGYDLNEVADGGFTCKEICEHIFKNINDFDESSLKENIIEEFNWRNFQFIDSLITTNNKKGYPFIVDFNKYYMFNKVKNPYMFVNFPNLGFIKLYEDILMAERSLHLMELKVASKITSKVGDFDFEYSEEFYTLYNQKLKKNKKYQKLSLQYEELKNKFDEQLLNYSKEDCEFLFKDLKDYYIFMHEYADDMRINATIECGGFFRKIPHFVFSHH